nr:MAG TPA: hypothetical protein [Caudoviricetes sp.]
MISRLEQTCSVMDYCPKLKKLRYFYKNMKKLKPI